MKCKCYQQLLLIFPSFFTTCLPLYPISFDWYPYLNVPWGLYLSSLPVSSLSIILQSGIILTYCLVSMFFPVDHDKLINVLLPEGWYWEGLPSPSSVCKDESHKFNLSIMNLIHFKYYESPLASSIHVHTLPNQQ